jgi:hypothetical protein
VIDHVIITNLQEIEPLHAVAMKHGGSLSRRIAWLPSCFLRVNPPG